MTSSKAFYQVIAVAAAMAAATTITSVDASEATQFIDSPSTATRTESVSQSARGTAPNVQRLGEATEFDDAASTLTRSTAKSRDDALVASPRVIRSGDATGFIDPAGIRSRVDVQAEARPQSHQMHN